MELNKLSVTIPGIFGLCLIINWQSPFLVNRFGYNIEIIGHIYLFNLFIKKPEELTLIYGTYPSGFYPKSVLFINL